MRFKISKNISWQIYEEAVYILDERTDTMNKLEDAGYWFWKYMQQNPEREYISVQLAKVYTIPRSEIEKDMDSFIEELQQEGYIEVKE